MTENTNNHTSESEALNQLSERVGKALEREAHRRRWASRGLILLAIIPVAAVVLVFLYGRSDVEQTQQIVQLQTRGIEDKVEKRITASVQQELKGVSEVRELLPELKQAVPQVKKVSQDLENTSKQVDSVLQNQDAIKRSLETTAKDLDTRVDWTERQVARVDKIGRSIDAVRSELDTTRKKMAQEFNARFNRIENTNNSQRLNRIEQQLRALDGKMNSAIREMSRNLDARLSQLQGASQSQQLNNIENRLRLLEGKMNQATDVVGAGIHSVNDINNKLTELYKMSHDLNRRIKKLESTRVQIRSRNQPIVIEQPQR